jgi:DNA repair protein RadC
MPIQVRRAAAKIMSQNLFLSNVAEIQISYSTKVKPSDRQKITCSKDAAEILRQIFPGFEHREFFYILTLNRANRVLGYFEVSKGGISGTVVDTKLILQAALKTNASGIIMCHNHPSGTLEASDADIKITQKVKSACSFLDLSMLDHLILTTDTYLSMADEGII